MLDEVRENPIKYIKSVAMDIIVVIVALAYVLYKMVTLKPQDLNPLILIAEALMGIICGVVIKQALGENGFSKGYNSKTWIDEEDKYNEACDSAIDYTDRVDNFYLELEREKKIKYRRDHLQAARLKYNQWFNEKGDYIGDPEKYEKLTLHQKLVVRKCIRVKIYVLNLFSQYAMASEQDTKKEATDKVQRNKSLTKNTFSAVAVSVIGVYFLPIFQWNIASLISATMQVSLWILFGIIQLYTNFNFVVQDRVAILKRKKELICRFVKDSQKGKYIESPYVEQEKTKEPPKTNEGEGEIVKEKDPE